LNINVICQNFDNFKLLIPSDLNIVHEDSYARRLFAHIVDLITNSKEVFT
jgi:hypothetical protein